MYDRKLYVPLLLALLVGLVLMYSSRQRWMASDDTSARTAPGPVDANPRPFQDALQSSNVAPALNNSLKAGEAQVIAQLTDPRREAALGTLITEERQCHPGLASIEDWRPPTCPSDVQDMDQLDPGLISHICQQWLLPPFSGPRHLKNDRREHYSQSDQSPFVDKLLGGRTDGFFIECGAAGGELNSNSLFFEKHRNWKGVLIEANPMFFHQLLGVNRHAHMVNACLSPTRKPMVLDFREADQIGGLVDFMETGHKKRVLSVKGEKEAIKVQCFPLISILKSLGITHVDYFSLDIEGAEVDILRSIPFDEVKIDVFTIEYAVSNDPKATRDKLAEIKEILVNQNGYKVEPYPGGREDVILSKL